MIDTAKRMSMDPDTFRSQNFYQEGQVTPCGTTLTYWNIPEIWQQIQETADYQARKAAVSAYNNANRWTKKGISIVTCKYGIEWTLQGFGAVINCYPDGTVELTHSGCEVGQGINTKVSQVLAYELGCPLNLITVTSTNTQKIPNGSTTGGSITSELCSNAVIEAAQKLNQTLRPFKILLKNASWTEIIALASSAGIDLQARAWNLQPAPADGGPFQYCCYGAAIAETRVDALTGEVQIERVDILYDSGTSLNPALDIGQVEGGFVQGIGQYVTERLLYDSQTGKLTSNGTWEYKPPSTKDIPIVMNSALLSNAPNPSGILSSKASGEPPMTLSCGVFFAIRDAVNAARVAAGLSDKLDFQAPATVDVVQTACGVTSSQLTLS